MKKYSPIAFTLCVLVLALLWPTIARSQETGARCTFRYFGHKGDTIFYGYDSFPTSPTAPVKISAFTAVLFDSLAPDGRLIWQVATRRFDVGNPQTVTAMVSQSPSGGIGGLDSLGTWVTTIDKYMCDTVGQTRMIWSYRISTELGYGAMYLLKRLMPVRAILLSDIERASGDTIPTHVVYFADRLGQVLQVDTHHGQESSRVVGAVIDGRLYGGSPTSVSEGSTTVRSVVFYQNEVRIWLGNAQTAMLSITDLQGQQVITQVVADADVVSLAALASGPYLVCLQDPLGGEAVVCKLVAVVR